MDSSKPSVPQRTLASVPWLDLGVAVAISGLAAFVWVESGTWFEARNLAQDPTVLPRGIAVVLWLAALGIVVKAVVRIVHGERESTGEASAVARLQSDVSEDSDQPSDHSAEDEGLGPPVDVLQQANWVGALIGVTGVGLYVAIAFNLGWVVTTWLFLVAGVLGLEQKRITAGRMAVVVVISAVAVGIIWTGFVALLNVRLPNTILF